MADVRKTHARSVPYEQVMEELLQDPEFARAYKELEPEFQIIRQVIALRNQQKMTQAELAKRVGTKQSSIARMESKGQIANLHLLQRVAEALDARVDVRLVPRKTTNKKARDRRLGRSAPGRRNGSKSARSV
jgi:DNA-binding XRE family transcriptional regulator